MIQKQYDQHTVLNYNPSVQQQPSPNTNTNTNTNNPHIVKILLIVLVMFVVVGCQLILMYDGNIYNLQQHTNNNNNTIQQQILSDSQLQQIIQKISTRPPKTNQKQKQKQKQKKLKPTRQAYLAYELYKHPDSKQYQTVQKYYYNKKYQIQKCNNNQLSICIVSTGRNVLYQYRYRRYIDSLARQQYNNFKVVVVDDNSSDGSVQAIRQYLLAYYQYTLLPKITIISNSNRSYALYNRHMAIIQYCSHDDIIVQLDMDDQFIGRQVLSTINAIYNTNPHIWIMYSSYIYWSAKHGQPTEGISQQIPAKILQEGTYRLTTQWYTSATRTFRRQLYTKIDKNDSMDGRGMFYRWCSDLFVHYSLVQMAGLEHYMYVHEIFYYYYLDHNPYRSVQKAIDRLDALSLDQYRPLKNLSQPSSRIPNNQNKQWLKQQKDNLLAKLNHNNNNN